MSASCLDGQLHDWEAALSGGSHQEQSIKYKKSLQLILSLIFFIIMVIIIMLSLSISQVCYELHIK